MDLEQIEAELRELGEQIADPPPLLTVVLLANGRGLAYRYPLWDEAGEGTLEQRHAVLTTARAFMADFVERLDSQIFALNEAASIYRHKSDEKG
jgi:hypothetical protein